MPEVVVWLLWCGEQVRTLEMEVEEMRERRLARFDGGGCVCRHCTHHSPSH